MICADLRERAGAPLWPVGALGCITGALHCERPPARCTTCRKAITESRPSLRCACENPTPDAGCAEPGEHSDPSPGCVRVVLERRPLDGEHGPFGYDPATRLPIPHAENTRRAREADLDRAALDKHRLLQRRAALLRAGKAQAALAVDAEVAAVDARIAALVEGVG